MSTIVIKVAGGVVQEVISDEPVKVVIIDRDVDGSAAEDIVEVHNAPAFIYRGIKEADVNEPLVRLILEETDRA